MAAKSDRDLFDRLRSAGLRKQVARRLSGIGEDAGRKAVGAARAAVAELRTLADEIERRLPVERPRASQTAHPAGRDDARARPGASGRASAGGSARGARSRAAAGGADATAKRAAPAPRGRNKALILQALAEGPKTAAEVARQTGIATGTTSTTLNKLVRSGEVVKAARGYALPSFQPSSATGESSGASAPSGEPSGASAPSGESSGASAPSGEPSGASAPSGEPPGEGSSPGSGA
jgi:hypothetical protein